MGEKLSELLGREVLRLMVWTALVVAGLTTVFVGFVLPQAILDFQAAWVDVSAWVSRCGIP